MAQVVTTYQFNDMKVHKILLTKHEEYPELLFTRYKLECWGAAGGSDLTGKKEGYYSASGNTYVAGKSGEYVCLYIEIGHDTEVFLATGVAGAENASGGWYGQTGMVRAGGPTSICFSGVDGSSTVDYSKPIIRATGGAGGTYITRSDPQKVTTDSFRVGSLDRTWIAPGRTTISKSHWTTYKNSTTSTPVYSSSASGRQGYCVWKNAKKETYYDKISYTTKTITFTNIKCTSNDEVGQWLIITLFSIWKYIDDTKAVYGKLTWTTIDPDRTKNPSQTGPEVTMAVGTPAETVSLVDGPDGGSTGSTGTIEWRLTCDMSYYVLLKLDSTEKIPYLQIKVLPWGNGGHRHSPGDDACSDVVKTFYWTYKYGLQSPRLCSYGNYVTDVNSYDSSFSTTLAPPDGGVNGYIRITRLDPVYMPNNVKNDDYRNLLIGRPIVEKDHMDDMFLRDLVGMRKDRWIQGFDYNVKMTNGFPPEAFEYLGFHFNASAYNCLIESVDGTEDLIITEPGIYEYFFSDEGIYLFECWGAAGGHDDYEDDIANARCGYGGYVAGICYINKDVEKATIYVGGQGSMTSSSVPHADGGFNGGSDADRPYNLDVDVGSGGGATDIRIGGTTLNDRILVAAGGGGKGPYEANIFGHANGFSSDYKSEGTIETNLLFGCENVPSYAPIRTYLSGGADPISFLSSFMINCERCNGTGIVSGQSTIDYVYNGEVQSITLEAGKTYKLEVWGAQGGGSTADTSLGGKGGYAYGYITPSSRSTLYIIVGGRGGHGNGQIDSSGSHSGSAGYNGGGTCNGGGAYGGGMTHMSLNTYDVARASYSWSPSGVIIVAGGGGGVSTGTGDRGVQTWNYQGRGQNGATGNEGNYRRDTSGGGGGWYGGASVSGDDPRYAYNGSCYIGGVTNGGYSDSVKTENGKARVTIPEERCPLCRGTKKHLDPSRLNEMVATLKISYIDHTGYQCSGGSPADCLPQDILSHQGVSASKFGYSESTETFTGYKINQSVLQNYIDAACANISNFTPLVSNIGSWTTSLLTEYIVNCPTCNGTGKISEGAEGTELATDVYEFAYTGGMQSFVATPGKYKLEVWGAKGGRTNGGYGGYSRGTITVSSNTSLYICVGGAGTTWGTQGQGGAGYNGGGLASANSSSTYCGGGGGATHIAARSGLLSLLSSFRNDVYIVAGGGGGGGGGSTSYSGGAGGGTTGNNGSGTNGSNASYSWNTRGKGGTQSVGGDGGFCGASITSTSTDYYSSAGTFGKGGDGYIGSASNTYLNTTGGGGGWYGGGGGGNNNHGSLGIPRGAGGGSGYIGGVQDGYTEVGANSGDGYARITRLEKMCPTCNGTKQHYDATKKTEIYNDIVNYVVDSVGDTLDEYNNTVIPASSPALTAYPMPVKGPGAGGGWYGGGLLRDQRNYIAAGGGSNYVYSEETASNYPTPKPSNDFKMFNIQDVGGISYKPMVNSYIDMRLGSTGNGAVRIRKLSVNTYQPQAVTLDGNATEIRDDQ